MSARRKLQRKKLEKEASRQVKKFFPNSTQRETIQRDIYQIKRSQFDISSICEWLQELEKATGKFYSLYVSQKFHYYSTIQVGGLGSRGPIEVTMIEKYPKYNGIYSTVGEFNDLLQKWKREGWNPSIHTGLLQNAEFKIDAGLDLTIKSQGYEEENSDILGKIQFLDPSLNGIKLGTLEEIPSELKDRLRSFLYQIYLVQGVDNFQDLFSFNPINPPATWPEEKKLYLFRHTLLTRSIRLI